MCSDKDESLSVKHLEKMVPLIKGILGVFFFSQAALGFDAEFPESHPHWKYIPSKCGVTSSDSKIVGGYKVELGAIPWIVRIAFRPDVNDPNRIVYACGGTLVSQYYVVTAAHCTTHPDAIAYVRIGELNALTDPDCSPETKKCADPVQDIAVSKVIRHENFIDNINNENDIALLRLDKPPTLSVYVQPICLHYGKSVHSNFEGEPTTVAGWGLTENYTLSDYLLAVDQNVTNKKHCAFKYKLAGVTLMPNDEQLCVGGIPGKDSCGGDSGGPLMWKTHNPSKTYLLGLVSMGPKACGSRLPGVYTRISTYLEWILDHIES